MSTYFTMINIKNRNDCNSNHDGWCTFPLNFLCNALTRLAYSPAIMLDPRPEVCKTEELDPSNIPISAMYFLYQNEHYNIRVDLSNVPILKIKKIFRFYLQDAGLWRRRRGRKPTWRIRHLPTKVPNRLKLVLSFGVCCKLLGWRTKVKVVKPRKSLTLTISTAKFS